MDLDNSNNDQAINPNINPNPTMLSDSTTVIGSSSASNLASVSNAVNNTSNLTSDTQMNSMSQGIGAISNETIGDGPVNPVINPGVGIVNQGEMSNPIIQPGSSQGLAATDPIMRPEPASAPDPIEEELKAPMKAASPVPGSIGSAISGPKSDLMGTGVDLAAENSFLGGQGGRVANVSFDDPTMRQETAQSNTGYVQKKKSRGVLIALIAIAILIVVALVAVLIIQIG